MWVAKGKLGSLPFGEVFDVPGYRFHRDGKGFQGEERTMCKCLVSWWRDRFIYRSKTVLMIVKCWRGHGHVYSTSLTGSINWPSSGAMLTKVLAWKANILHLTFCARKNSGESGVNCRIRTAHSLRIKWKKMGLLLLTEKLLTNFGRLRTGLSMMETSAS